MFFSSCGTPTGQFKIEGRFLHINQGELYVYSLDGGMAGLDTIKIQAGRFAYETSMAQESTLMLVFPNFSEHPVFAKSGASVDIQADASHLKEMTVKGTDENELMNKFRKIVVNASPPEEKELARQFIEDHPESQVAVFLLRKYFVQALTPDYAAAQKLLKTLVEAQPENHRLLVMQQQVTSLARSQVGARLPRFKATDVNGKSISGDALRKDVAVVSVWCGWNYESLEIQRTLRDLNKAHDGKLQLLSICVDAVKKDCQDRMESNELTWATVCDEQMMEGALLQQIGMATTADNMVLVNGKIVARGLNNGDLRNKINDLMK